MKTVIEMAREAGLENSWDQNWFSPEIERFAALVREDERSRSQSVNDEIIAELWHKAGGHLHRFARLLEQFIAATQRSVK